MNKKRTYFILPAPFTSLDNKSQVNLDHDSESSGLLFFKQNHVVTAELPLNDRPRHKVYGWVLALMMICIVQPASILAQTCSGVVLSSQSQINNLASTCTLLNGNLRITETTPGDIVDLTPLRTLNIENIGNLTIEENSLLESLDGLEGLKSIASSITIFDNPLLKNVDALEGMEQMRGYINIYYNNSIENLNGFRNITQNPRGFNGLNIIGNPVLTSLDGLEGLKTFDDLIDVSENATLMNIDGLEGLRGSSSSNFEIYDNPQLMNIDGLQNLSAADFISIFDNSILSDFCGLHPLFSSDPNYNYYYFSGNAANPTGQDIIAGGPCIPDPAALISELLTNGNITSGNANALLVKLNNCNLGPFTNQVNAFANAGKLTQAQADDLIAGATTQCATTRRAVAAGFSLGQNYPNPGDGYTWIPFSLPATAEVSLRLFDATGKVVKILLEETLESGIHEVKMDVRSLTDGMYFYQLRVGGDIHTLPMMVK